MSADADDEEQALRPLVFKKHYSTHFTKTALFPANTPTFWRERVTRDAALGDGVAPMPKGVWKGLSDKCAQTTTKPATMNL